MEELKEQEKVVNTEDYGTFITEALGLDTIYFSKFGSYQGIWLLVAKDNENYYLFKDYYGSCSGCDELEGEFDSQTTPLSKAKEFVEKKYKPFLTISKPNMQHILESGNLDALFPKNIRTYDDEINYKDAEVDIALSLATDQDTVTADLILKAKNQEIKQKGLKKMGYDKFVEQAKPEVIHSEGEDELLSIDPHEKGVEAIKFVHVKDASTDRKYLLRVPPTMTRTKEAIAWTFGMKEDEYTPLKET